MYDVCCFAQINLFEKRNENWHWHWIPYFLLPLFYFCEIFPCKTTCVGAAYRQIKTLQLLFNIETFVWKCVPSFGKNSHATISGCLYTSDFNVRMESRKNYLPMYISIRRSKYLRIFLLGRKKIEQQNEYIHNKTRHECKMNVHYISTGDCKAIAG